MRSVVRIMMLIALICASFAPGFSQVNSNQQTYFKDYIGLDDTELQPIRNGQAIARTLHSRSPDEIFVFGAIYIHATPTSGILGNR